MHRLQSLSNLPIRKHCTARSCSHRTQARFRRFKPHGVHITRADGGDAAPFGNIALPAAVIPDRNDASGAQNAVARVVSGCNVNHTRPSFRYALPVIVPAAADNRSVASQPERVVSVRRRPELYLSTNQRRCGHRKISRQPQRCRSPAAENEVFPSDSDRTYPAPRDCFAFPAGTRERNGSVKIPQRIKNPLPPAAGCFAASSGFPQSYPLIVHSLRTRN